ncbi:MAG: hypothetical protein EA424_04830 [Planctomycetaceae bacterium]|nr:MAG: hypothetical protein EA424_04830 [Planctomycetaceae bacterium]
MALGKGYPPRKQAVDVFRSKHPARYFFMESAEGVACGSRAPSGTQLGSRCPPEKLVPLGAQDPLCCWPKTTPDPLGLTRAGATVIDKKLLVGCLFIGIRE